MAEPFAVVVMSMMVSCAGIFGMGLLFRSYQIDRFREDLSALRDEAFLYAYDQGLIGHEAHQTFRSLLDSLLRSSEKVTFIHVVTLLLARKLASLSFAREMSPLRTRQDVISPLVIDQQDQFKSFNKRVLNLVEKQVIFRSFLLCGFATLVVVPRLLVGQISASKSRVMNAVRSMLPIDLPVVAEMVRE